MTCIDVHKSVGNDMGAYQATVTPRQPVFGIEETLGDFLQSAARDDKDITLVFVTDGLRPSPKQETNAARLTLSENAQSMLLDLLSEGDVSKEKEVKKQRKAAVRVTEDMVAM